MEELHSIVIELSKSMDLALGAEVTLEECKEVLGNYIDSLVTHDFNKLVQILYRLDISERTLRANLENSTTNVGKIIAEMIIERQIEKIKSRKRFRNDRDIADEEKW